MKTCFKYICLFVCMACFYNCQDDLRIENLSDSEFSNLPKTITVSLGNSNASSRLAYEEVDNASLKVLKSTWETDDVVYVNPYASSTVSSGENVTEYKWFATYKLKSGQGTSVGVFELDENNSVWNSTIEVQNYYLYYGTDIKSDVDFLNHSYESQTQNGNDNKNHIGSLHAVRAQFSFDNNTSFDESYVDLSSENVIQSSCFKLDLKGFPEAITPTKVSLIVLDANNFWRDVFGKYNYLQTAVNVEQSDFKNDKLDKLSLNLEGFESTQSIIAYMMMSNRPVSLEVGSKLRVLVESNNKKYIADKEITSNKELAGGKYHILTISSGWQEYNVTSSSDYSNDGTFTTKQTASANGISRGVDLVFMGDGFVDTAISDGTYTGVLEQAYEDFFSVEPLKSLKSYFNVYYVNAVSENQQAINLVEGNSNGATGTGANTKFATYFTPGATATGGNNDLVMEYAKKALVTDADTRIKTAQMVVVINAECHAGTNHYYIDETTDYGASWGIAYTPKANNLDATGEARRLTLVHEAGGHGVGATSGIISAVHGDRPDHAGAVHCGFHHRIRTDD